MTKKRTKPYKKWTQEDLVQFVRVWQGADYLEEVMEAFRISYDTAKQKGRFLRVERGVNLRKLGLKPRRPDIDYDSLAKLADELSEDLQ